MDQEKSTERYIYWLVWETSPANISDSISTVWEWSFDFERRKISHNSKDADWQEFGPWRY